MSSVENAENGVGKYSYQTVYYIITNNNNNNSTEEGESDQVENLHAVRYGMKGRERDGGKKGINTRSKGQTQRLRRVQTTSFRQH